MSAAEDYIRAALDSLDVQMRDLQLRLQNDVRVLRSAIENARLAEQQAATLTAAADRIQQTATVVSGLSQPSAVADPDQPDTTAAVVDTGADSPPFNEEGRDDDDGETGVDDVEIDLDGGDVDDDDAAAADTANERRG